ncbi:hypothetical protein A6J53_06390 [Neisseria meningitidis]|nr:hypothetical protein A6J53_06390 [Neisseria meningitidis]ARB71196.1 hypothetical protein A6J54_05070 [Neisseria meningitidis]ARC10224.1 hypothetical protein A6J50_07645 [Neisseria meningitidis]
MTAERFLLFRRSFCNPRISLFPQKTETRNSNLKPRHSRKSGNPVRSVSVVSDKFLLLFISRFPLSWE